MCSQLPRTLRKPIQNTHNKVHIIRTDRALFERKQTCNEAHTRKQTVRIASLEFTLVSRGGPTLERMHRICSDKSSGHKSVARNLTTCARAVLLSVINAPPTTHRSGLRPRIRDTTPKYASVYGNLALASDIDRQCASIASGDVHFGVAIAVSQLLSLRGSLLMK